MPSDDLPADPELTDTTPPSPLHHHEFENGDITVTARYAKLIPGDPDRLYVFAARDLTVHGTTITPPHNRDDDNPHSELRAYYIGNEENVTVYFLENWGDEAVIGFEPCYAIIELHELTHWAVPIEDNEQDPDHWDAWNTVLLDVVEYVMDTDDLQPETYTPTITETSDTNSDTMQLTLSDIP